MWAASLTQGETDNVSVLFRTRGLRRDAVLVSASEFSELGVPHPCVLRTLRPEAELLVGDDVGMSGCSLCATERVVIGDRALLGAGVNIADTDSHPTRVEGRRWSREGVGVATVVIGDDVFLGERAIVLKGVTVGDGAVIAAGAVVTRDIPAGAIAAGVPASVVGSVEGSTHPASATR